MISVFFPICAIQLLRCICFLWYVKVSFLYLQLTFTNFIFRLLLGLGIFNDHFYFFGSLYILFYIHKYFFAHEEVRMTSSYHLLDTRLWNFNKHWRTIIFPNHLTKKVIFILIATGLIINMELEEFLSESFKILIQLYL